ncbi:MAG: hypothetical protein JST11_24355 [Acidobacteria bacterium]|nr:hypothetical protein [Acidobacteriota bacterium]
MILLLLGGVCQAGELRHLTNLNEPIVLSFQEVPGAEQLSVPVQKGALQVCLNGTAADWVVPEMDWPQRKMIVRLLGPDGDAEAGVHARAIRGMMRRASGEDQLWVCVKTAAGPCREFSIAVGAAGSRETLWVAILGLGILLPFVFPRVLRTGVRDSRGNRTGWERISLSASTFYAWNIVVLASVAYVWAVTGEWTVNQTAMAMLGMAGATRGGAKFVPGSRLPAVSPQPVPGTGLGNAPPQAAAGGLVADPAQPGPSMQPPASPPAGSADAGPSPNAFAATSQAVLRILSQTLTDSDGPAAHRVQLAVWTALLLCWYARAVVLDWALPEFDLSLLGIGVASGGFHVLSKAGERISRTDIVPNTKKERPSRMRSTKRVAASAAVLLMLSGASLSLAQAVNPQKKPQPSGDTGGPTSSDDTTAGPKGTAPAGGGGNDQPADRQWKLANEPLMLLPAADQNLPKTKPPYLAVPDIQALIKDLAARNVAGVVPDSDRKNCTDPTEPWIIQAAVWSADKDDKPARVETYLYDPRKPPAKQEDLQRTRIYGSKKACFVLLVYASAASREAVRAAATRNPQTQANVAKLLRGPDELASGDAKAFMPVAGEPGVGDRGAGEGLFVRKLHAATGQFYAAKGKTAAPLQDLISLLSLGKFLQGKSGGTTATAPVWIFGLNEVDDLPEPSDLWLQTGRPGPEVNPTAFTPYSPEVQFDNEGYYWYDFSVAFPVNKVDALEYNQGDSVVQTRQVDLKAVYATGNLFLHKADIKDPSTLWVPRLLFGIGIQGKPFDRMFVGAGFGFGFLHWAPLQAVQPFAGLSFNRVAQVEGSGSSAVVASRTIHKLVVGINVPVKSVVDRLKSSSSGGGK